MTDANVRRRPSTIARARDHRHGQRGEETPAREAGVRVANADSPRAVLVRAYSVCARPITVSLQRHRRARRCRKRPLDGRRRACRRRRRARDRQRQRRAPTVRSAPPSEARPSDRDDRRFLRPILQRQQPERRRRHVREQFLPVHVRPAVVPAAGGAHAIDQHALADVDPVGGAGRQAAANFFMSSRTSAVGSTQLKVPSIQGQACRLLSCRITSVCSKRHTLDIEQAARDGRRIRRKFSVLTAGRGRSGPETRS